MTDLILIGAGPNARMIIAELRRAGHMAMSATDVDDALHGKTIDGVPILGGDAVVEARKPGDVILVNTIGNRGAAIGRNGLNRRRAVFEHFKSRGYSFASVVSVAAMISPAARLSEGCHIITGAIVQAHAVVGANTIVNTGAQIDHDTHVGAHCHIAPGAVICGDVTIGDEVHIGAGAVIVHDLKIGDGALIGAGAVVVADVPAGVTVLGNPARPVAR